MPSSQVVDSTASQKDTSVGKQLGLSKVEAAAALQNLILEVWVGSEERQHLIVAAVNKEVVGLCKEWDKPFLECVVLLVGNVVTPERNGGNLKEILALNKARVRVPCNLELEGATIDEIFHPEVLSLLVDGTKNGDSIPKTASAVNTLKVKGLTNRHLVSKKMLSRTILKVVDGNHLREIGRWLVAWNCARQKLAIG